MGLVEAGGRPTNQPLGFKSRVFIKSMNKKIEFYGLTGENL